MFKCIDTVNIHFTLFHIYFSIILAILVGQLFQWTGYLVCISYCGLALAFFMVSSFYSAVLLVFAKTFS